ncbi:NAD(P)/FAD-dependent oxidoreductase [Aromatoleum petrolei]|uniref:FAD-dependent oxidoreductase n=1 Tax=Aromatoleum petrolei TaxID=76116 RepID=A0ABX1MHB7_9RHOO|nr:FAD-binding oxidoreductase [Aromatoleum petrolei]NMF87320.1 FAD-dependent oxidoreductase [Aromatoleum petrolei]QTQ38567.1 Putative oxidoreductase, FAD dependent [Aromatoleum petrolei]
MTKEYSAKRLPKHAGPAAWDEILGPRTPNPALDGDRSCDFAIIGAGFAGLYAARRLAQLNPGARIVLLDAGCIGKGGTGRNSGFMIDLPHELTSSNYAGADEGSDSSLIALNRWGIDYARQAVVEYGIDPNYFDPAGKVNGAASDASHAQNLSYAKHLESLGERYELLDEKGMFELTGSRYYRSGLFTPGTVMLQPAGYVRGLARGLAPVVDIYENTPVTGFRREGATWRVATPRGTVTAGKLILSNNGHIESFGIKRGRLMHIMLFACMTEELGPEVLARLGGRSRWGVTPSDPMGTTMRRIDAGQGGNRIVTRTCAEFRPDMESTEHGMRRATEVMRGKFDARFPNLSDVKMAYVWSGHLCLSKNSVSVTGEIDDGVFAACVQNGLGSMRGTLTGICAAELASGVSSPVTAFFAREPEPPRLPLEPIAAIGANAVIRCKEWLARKE